MPDVLRAKAVGAENMAQVHPGAFLVQASARLFLALGAAAMLAATGVRALGAITPFGGAAFVLAWALFAFAVLKR